jgi:hypothetical protein
VRKDEGHSDFGTYRGILSISSLKKAYRIIIKNLTERGYIEDGYRSGRIIHEYLSVCELPCVSGFGSANENAQTSSHNRLTL